MISENVNPPSPQTEKLPPEQAETQLSPELQALLGEAVKVMYGPTFEKMVALFENNPGSFEENVATVINAVIAKLEKTHGDLDINAVGAIAGALFRMLVEDLVSAGLVQDLTQDMIIGALQRGISVWVSANQDRIDPNEIGQSLQELEASLTSQGVDETSRGETA